jgi:hypothetical protein
MTSETKKALQLVLNSNDKPAFITVDDKIVLTNETFKNQGYTVVNYEDRAEDLHCRIIEKNLDNDFTLCEIVNCELYLLQQSQIKLHKAMALL